MDIAALSMNLASIDTSSRVGVAVLAKGLESVEEMGEGIQKMMEMSVNPGVGANFDVSL